MRYYLNDYLREYHGHIGYGIRRDCRGKGYATKGLALLLEIGKNIIEDDECYYTRISLK